MSEEPFLLSVDPFIGAFEFKSVPPRQVVDFGGKRLDLIRQVENRVKE
jgi:hypothetical protein